MTQAQNILNRFSDDYLASRLREIDGAGSSEVLATYQQTHPDLQNELNEQAASLNLLYGSLENEAQISDTDRNRHLGIDHNREIKHHQFPQNTRERAVR